MNDHDFIETILYDLCEMTTRPPTANVYQLRKGKTWIEVYGEQQVNLAAAEFRYKDAALLMQLDARTGFLSVYFIRVGHGYPCYYDIDFELLYYSLEDREGGSPLTFNLADPELVDKIVARCDRVIVGVKRKLGIDQEAACNPAKWRRYIRDFMATPRELQAEEWVEDIA